jgi:S-adenosylmethionine hydrolase
MLYEDSFQNIAVAISGGDAAVMFGATPGDKIIIRLRES